MGGKSGGAKINVVDYRISLHLGVCVGPVDAIKGIRIGDKPIGNPTFHANGEWGVDNRDLFGGPKKGGGIDGIIHFLFGRQNQLLSEFLAAKYGRTPTTMTGYRDITSIFLTSRYNATDEEKKPDQGFTIGSNNPVVPAIDVTVTRQPKGLNDGRAAIGDDANPPHIIYECLTDENFGVGYDISQIDLNSFLKVSQTLYEEGFGLSYQWMTSTPIEQFVNEVLETISANMTFNLATGKWELLLLRGDYDPVALQLVYPGNANLTSFQRKGWGETINEIVVTWSNPENEGDETVTVHDNTNLAIQGGTVSDPSKNFPGIRSNALALKVAERELRQSSAPLASAEVDVDRTLWNLKPGAVVKFLWPEYDIHTPIIMRVLKTNYGTKGSPSVKVSLLEDVFSFGISIVDTQPNEGTPPGQDPIDPPFYMISSPPYYLFANVVGDDVAALSEFPETRSWLLSHSGLTDIRNIDVLSLERQPDDSMAFTDATTINESYRFTLPEVLPVSSYISTIPVTPQQRSNIRVGSFMLISPFNSPTRQEILKVVKVESGFITVQRGILDTVPRQWNAGTPIWVIKRDQNMIDIAPRSVGETANYKFLPITSRGRLAESKATTRLATLPARIQNPMRPANTKLNGNALGVVTQIAPGVDVVATWSRRNRKTETAATLHWSAGDTAPEEGQTVRLLIRDATSTLTTIPNLEGTSYTITAADLGNPVAGDDRFIRFYARRDGLNSFQYAEMKVEIRSP